MPTEQPRAPRAELVRLGSGRGAPALVCPSALDGSPLIYRDLVTRLGPRVTAYGFDTRTALIERRAGRTLRQMAADYVRELLQVQPTGPYVLFGFSAGGLLALEMARTLRTQHAQEPLVVLGDTQLPQDEARTSDWLLGWCLFAEVYCEPYVREQFLLGQPGTSPFWSGTVDDRLRLLASARLNAQRDDGYEEMRRDYDAFQSHLRAFTEYEPEPYDGRAIFLSALPPSLVDRLVAPLRVSTVRIVSLGHREHLQLVQPPGVDKTADYLRTVLDQHG